MANIAGFGGGLSVSNLEKFLNKFVAEVVFVRRRKPKDPSVSSKTRRMICTTNQVLLKSPFGMKTLRYKPATQSPPYNARAKGLYPCQLPQKKILIDLNCFILLN